MLVIAGSACGAFIQNPIVRRPSIPRLSLEYMSQSDLDIGIIVGVEAYDELRSAKQENRFVCVKIYASWCRACKAAAPKYERIASNHAHIEFYELEFTANKPLVKRWASKCCQSYRS